MPGYFVFELDVFDHETFDDYARIARPMFARHGGTIIINSGSIEPLEGDWKPSSIVVAQFPSIDAARAFYNCEEYREVIGLRDRSARSRGILLESP
jgi:uncharacterized protein (DUF1330 family)